MAITKEKKADFNDKLVDFKNYLEELKKEANIYKVQAKKSKDMEPYFNLSLAINSIKTINTCIVINELSTAILEINNNNYLETARKEIYNCISYIEKTVGNNVDGSLSENKELLAKIERFTPTQRLNLIKGLLQAMKKPSLPLEPTPSGNGLGRISIFALLPVLKIFLILLPMKESRIWKILITTFAKNILILSLNLLTKQHRIIGQNLKCLHKIPQI